MKYLWMLAPAALFFIGSYKMFYEQSFTSGTEAFLWWIGGVMVGSVVISILDECE